MKSQDIVILLKLVSLEQGEPGTVHPGANAPHEDPFSVRALEASLGISKTEVNASINRSLTSGLAVRDHLSGHPKPNRRDLCNFIARGVKFVFPAKAGAIARGVPTAFAAPSLKNLLRSAGEYIYVWPSAKGNDKGQSLDPLFKSVPDAVQKDDRLYEYLALVDAVRIGAQREAGLAGERLAKGLLQNDQH